MAPAAKPSIPPAHRAAVETILAAHYRIDPAELWQRRSAHDNLAAVRQAAAYLLAVALDQPRHRVAAAIHRHHSTVAHACIQVEQRRDDPQFDATLDNLEAGIRIALLTAKPAHSASHVDTNQHASCDTGAA